MPDKKDHANYDQVMATIKSEQVRFINLEFTDVVGITKCVTIPVEQFAHCIRYGKWFDGSALESIARVAESDMYLYPDLSTFTIHSGYIHQATTIGSEQNSHPSNGDVVARVTCDICTPDGLRFDGDPRTVLTRALEEARTLGFKYHVAPELEFFLLQFEKKKPIPLSDDPGSYFDLSTNAAVSIRSQMVHELQRIGIQIEASYHEVAAGQHEIDFTTGDALRIADNLMITKSVLKTIAVRHGLYVTFLPKPFYGVNGSGLHIHQQLLSLENGKNVFSDEHAEYGLSAVGRSFIAGQIAHARSMCALLAPLINSYKRLVRGYEAPVYVNWGRVNRQALIRVPRAGTDPHHAMRIELRCADPCSNPYLALAVMLRAGLDGIKHDMELPPAMDENIFLQDENERHLPRTRLLPATLGEALEAMREDPLIREALGETIYEGFVDAKGIEWTEYSQQVHQWEIERYLPIF